MPQVISAALLLLSLLFAFMRSYWELSIHEEIVGAVHKDMAVYGEQAQGTVNMELSIHEEIVGAVHKLSLIHISEPTRPY